MSRLDFVETTTKTTTLTAAARKLANKERRDAGRERNEERKELRKSLAWTRRWDKDPYKRQEQRLSHDTRAFTGRTLDFHRNITRDDDGDTDDDADAAAAAAADAHHEQREEKGKMREGEGELRVVIPQEMASGTMLLAMARPAKTRHGRRGRDHHSSFAAMTDGEAFEFIEVDGRLVALDEDGWEILPDENAEGAFVLYSDIVRGIVR